MVFMTYDARGDAAVGILAVGAELHADHGLERPLADQVERLVGVGH